jgi:hypothetical protein
MVNNEDLLDTIEAMFLNQTYLQKHFWPNVKKIAVTQKNVALSPFSKLFAMSQKAFEQNYAKSELENELNRTDDMNWNRLSLRERMDNLGHTRLAEPEVSTTNAAKYFLQRAYAKVVKIMDTQWHSKHRASPVASSRPRATNTNKTPHKDTTQNHESPARIGGKKVARTAQSKPSNNTRGTPVNGEVSRGSPASRASKQALNVVSMNRANRSGNASDKRNSNSIRRAPTANNKRIERPQTAKTPPSAIPQTASGNLPDDYLDLDSLFK